ncbi:MAG TPA: sigma-70 family RNA polymerase sigma factor [Candidatus Omnitrophota bacterium]|nr:sigma-70 family RNA polymerase sigma factor [Candidatus Omnitrophota bacterium]
MHEIDRDIIIKASQGDISSFESIFKMYSSYVFNVALRMTRERQGAQEITQDVFLTLYHKLKDFQYQASLKTWIYRITVNHSINYMKKQGQWTNKVVYQQDEHVASVANDIYKNLEKEYHENVIEKLLAVLTPEQRVCIVLRNMEGLSYEEIAQALNVDINVVRSRLKRAREKLLSVKQEVMAYEL